MQRHVVLCEEDDEIEAMLARKHEQRKAAASAHHWRMCRPSDSGQGMLAKGAKGAAAASAPSQEQEQGGGALASALRSQGGQTGSRSFPGPSSAACATGGSTEAIASFQKIRWRQSERVGHTSTVSSIRELTARASEQLTDRIAGQKSNCDSSSPNGPCRGPAAS